MGITIGALHVRRSVFINAPPQRVWQEFSSEERIKGWLDQGHQLHTLEPRIGAVAEFSVDIDGNPASFGGPVLAVEPERELSIETQWHGSAAWSAPTYWTYRLSGVLSGTLVEFFHHGFEQFGAKASEEFIGYEAGWGVNHLSTLRDVVEGG